jgi:predicted deacylase
MNRRRIRFAARLLLSAVLLGLLPAAAEDSVGPPWSPASVLLGPPSLEPAGDPMSDAFVGPPQMPNFRILDQEVLPGARARLEWSASQSFSGSEVVSPVIVAHGLRPGPVLCLTAGIHGDELNGVEIVRRIAHGIDPQQLSGTLIGVPIVNLFGFSRGSRYLPDRRDLNRFFPGTRVGSIASRIAHSFFESVVSHCDALVDFHTGSFDRSNLPQVRADLANPEVLAFAGKFGDTPVLHSAGAKGMLRSAASRAGIPAVTFESGAPSMLQIPEIEASVRSMESLLYELGMTADVPASTEPQAIFYDSQWVRADSGGILISHVELGDRVTVGQSMGAVVDPINNIERVISSPVNGRVIGMARNQVVLPGFAAYHVGEEKTADAAAQDAAEGDTTGAVEEEYSDPPRPEREAEEEAEAEFD